MVRETLVDIVGPARRARGLSQNDLADRVGMSQEWVSGVERGKTKHPGIDALHRLADELRLPVDRLVIAAGYATTPEGAWNVIDEAAAEDADPIEEIHRRIDRVLRDARWDRDRIRFLVGIVESTVNQLVITDPKPRSGNGRKKKARKAVDQSTTPAEDAVR